MGVFVQGVFVRGFMSGGFLSGGFCPRTERTVVCVPACTNIPVVHWFFV